jgi:hypothetical protein
LPGIGEDKKNQLQIDMVFGSLNEGSEKYCVLLAVKDALYELTHGPDACEVGENAEAVREPVIPVTSARKASGLNG